MEGCETPGKDHDSTDKEAPHILTQSKSIIAAKMHTHILNLTMYNDDVGYKKFPQQILRVSKYPVTFLVDSGATNSVLRTDALPQPPLNNGDTRLTVGSSGVPTLKHCSVPLECELDDQWTKHSFIM